MEGTISQSQTLPQAPMASPDTSYDGESGTDVDGFTGESLDRRSWYYNRRMIAQSQAYGMDRVHENGNGLAMVDEPTTPQKFANFLSRHNPLKRTKSVSKLDRNKASFKLDSTSHLRRGLGSQHNLAMPSTSTATADSMVPGHLHPFHNAHPMRASQSHESLLSYSTTTHMIGLGPQAELRALHPSVLSTPNCIQICTSSGATKYYQCRTPAERDRWMECLQRTMCPNRDEQRRTENSMQIWILEAKGLPAKRKYFCELCFDKVLYGRTSAKPRTDMCFWGEQFEFNHLKKVDMICINLYREADRRKKKDRSTLIGYIQIPVAQLQSRHPVERWYTVNTGTSEKTSSWASRSTSTSDAVSIRVKARYQSVDVLPLRIYNRLLNYVEHNYLAICAAVEPALTARAKEDFVTGLIKVLHKRECAKDLLCDLVMAEVANLENDNLMFRGNSLATKAMEAYQKLVADHYLQETLGEFVRSLLDSEDDCEVDPLKLGDLRQLDAHRRQLLYQVEVAWGKIVNSAHQFPSELRAVFSELRTRLSAAGRQELADNLVSASIFLRFLCPAILSPSLFNLCTEYPSDRAARNLTLVAKTLQTLANFSKFSGKEHYMEFMNAFVEREWENMKGFLKQLSNSGPPNSQSGSRRSVYGGAIDSTAPIDLGRELAVLHDYLDDSLAAVAPSKLPELRVVIASLTQARDDPDAALDLLLSTDTAIAGIVPRQPQVTPLKLRQPSITAGTQRNSTIVQVSSPTSDYENNDVTPSDGQMPRFTALSEDMNGNAFVMDRRSQLRKQPTAADAVSGRVPLTFADDSRGSARPLDVSTEDDDVVTPTQPQMDGLHANGATSSGYHSSQSGGSNSSSPVERTATTSTSSSSPQQPLAIANPLYSSIHIGGNSGPRHQQHFASTPAQSARALMCQSLPDVHQAVSLTPDTSFEPDNDDVNDWFNSHQQHNLKQPHQLPALTTTKRGYPTRQSDATQTDLTSLSPVPNHRVTQSMTPTTLHTLLSANSPPLLDNSSSGASSASSTTSSNPGTAQRQQQPRTNPRYAVHRSTLTNGVPINVLNGASPSSTSSSSVKYKPLLLNTQSVDSTTFTRQLPSNSSSGTSSQQPTPNSSSQGSASTTTSLYNPRVLMRRTNTCDVITRQRPATIQNGTQQRNGAPPSSTQSQQSSGGYYRDNSTVTRRNTAQVMARQAADVVRQQQAHSRHSAELSELPEQVAQRLAETERRLREAEQREREWRMKYEETNKPKWQEHIKPVMERLHQLENDMKQQVLASQQKQKMIEEQQRQIESLTHANARLNQLYTSRESLDFLASTPETNNNNRLNVRKQSAPPSGILKNSNITPNINNNNNNNSAFMTPDATPLLDKHSNSSSSSSPHAPRHGLTMAGDRTSVVVVEPVN